MFIRLFFSSRRRHTRYWRDWSSDVCSSDLGSGHLFPASLLCCVLAPALDVRGSSGGVRWKKAACGYQAARRGRRALTYFHLLPEESPSAFRCIVACVSQRSEEHTSELQSRQYLVCRLLLEKKNNT